MYDAFRSSEGMSVEVSKSQNSAHEVQHANCDLLNLGGYFNVEFWRNGVCFEKFNPHNLVTTQGKNSILDIMFGAATQITAWYMGLVTTGSFTAFAATDTAAQIGGSNGWTESTVYSGGARKSWSPSAASSGSITNSSVVTFNITSSDTLKGAFIVSSSSGTSGKLWAEVAFPSSIPVSNGDDVKVTYTLSS